MRHPALRRSARHSSKREPRPDPAKMSPPEAAAVPADPVSPGNLHSSHDPAAQNRPAPGVPPDGDHNQVASGKKGSITNGISGRSKTPESGLKPPDCGTRATIKIFCTKHDGRVFLFARHIYTQFLDR